ncbi:MAG: hypothetical protein KGQ59_05415 [Bdellovibrionales bacterium]|nr:hypothetical protein [Bdellovibrionales bacterium]
MLRLMIPLLASLSVTFPTFAEEAKTSTRSQTASGPIAPGEAEILWERAQEQIAEKKLDEAALTLERLVNRIPTHSRSLNAQKLLGEVELERGNAAKALEWLKLAWNNLKGQGNAAREIDLLRARAYLRLQKGAEALLVADKLLADADSGKISWGIDAQIIKTRALLSLKQFKRVETSLVASRRRKLEESLNPALAALWLEVLELQFMETKCNRFPSSKVLTEEQVIDQSGRHTACVIQARSQHQKIQTWATNSLTSSREPLSLAEASWKKISEHFLSSCEHPPLPPGKRTAKELETYLAELMLALQSNCSQVKGP